MQVEQLGVSRATLARYQELYKFLVEFPRFFRVKISYTALLKYAKPIKTKLKQDSAASALWKDLRRD